MDNYDAMLHVHTMHTAPLIKVYYIVLSDTKLCVQLIHNHAVDCYVIQPGTNCECDPTASVTTGTYNTNCM